jgi:hypothetical protein
MLWKCCGNLKLRYGTLRQFSRKQRFTVLTQNQLTSVQRLSPKNKEVSPYIALQEGYKATHLWLHVTSLAISFSQCYMTFMFQFFKFYHSALLSLPPISSEHSLFLFWPSSLLQKRVRTLVVSGLWEAYISTVVLNDSLSLAQPQPQKTARDEMQHSCFS